MIIEIKDIPQGKKIKHLSVDIDFTDFTDFSDSETSSENEIKPIANPITNPVVKTVSEKMPVPEKVVKVKKTPEKEQKVEKTEKLDSLPEVNITDREEKAIPEEMTNLEF